MIVKNECMRILRALESARPYISTFAIFDTGSTDGTDEIIREWGEKNGIPGIVAHGTFIDFSQARNQALELARSWHKNPTADVPPFSYILLMDADMELVVEGKHMIVDGAGEMYEMIQKAGAVSYHNPRLLSVHSTATYIGVTHEFLNVPPAGVVSGAHFRDHADGSNRVEKYDRDVKLLLKDLETDPHNPRSWFYLGNSYRDGNKPEDAIDAYLMRLSIGGWDEEDFITRCNIACCYKDLNNQAEFIHWALLAYEHRPTRAESLYDLAHYFREKGRNELAAVFAEMGINIPKPNDKLFVNDYVYDHGFREELSIAGWYTDRREKAFRVANGLALDPTAPAHLRHQSRTNMVHYLRPLKHFCPTTTMVKVDIPTSTGFVAMNPSIANTSDGGMEMIVRTVNYKIDEHGRYMIGEKGCGDAPIATENWLMKVDAYLDTKSPQVIVWDRPLPKFELVIGLEDMRLFWRAGRRRFSACVREQSDRGECEQWQGTLDRRDTHVVVTDDKRISDGTCTEKNWAPYGYTDKYVHRLGTLISETGERFPIPCPYAAENISGSSQWVPFSGGYLSIVHEAVYHPNHGKRVYQHRFAFYDLTLTKLTLSLPFVFQDVQIEFCAGLASIGGDLVASFGVRDCEAWLARVSMRDVAAMLWGTK
jgi:glycosyltransferase involved in cell wall biosynthesis